MLNASLLWFDSSGRIKALALADFPAPRFNGGTPAADLGNLVGTEAGTQFVFHNGLKYTNPEGGIAVANGGTIANHSQGGMPVDADGNLCVEYNGLPVSHIAGIPITATGRVAVAIPAPPINLSGFSNGFSNGFK